MRLFLIAKVLLDFGGTISLAAIRNWPMALMFLGFTIADVGALWLA